MKKKLLACLMSVIFPLGGLGGCQGADVGPQEVKSTMEETKSKVSTATFAGGCFWCSEADFEKIPGVIKVVSGYTGGSTDNPSYEEVSSGKTGHVEAVQVVYDPAEVTYEQLLAAYWRHIDPTDAGGQFADRGSQYQTAIFYHDDEQKRIAEKSREDLAKSGKFKKPLATAIVKFGTFYAAEDYHQDYSKKEPRHYQAYRQGSGREDFIKNVWGGAAGKGPSGAAPYRKPDDAALRKKLTPRQYDVTQKNGTERAFENEYWDSKKEGIYVDIVSGEPLFSSLDKYDSGTGWPSFTKPLEPGNIVEKSDRSFFAERTEVRSKHGDSHLGHVFPDRPKPTGLRYCLNSAALRFIPREDLAKEGYGQYRGLFLKR